MKALVYYEKGENGKPGKCEMREVPEPSVNDIPDGIKVQIDYCAMCATDVHIVTMGLYNWPTPWIMGHESVGTIVEMTDLASKISDFKVGDKVVIYRQKSCGICDQCKRGNDIFCTNPYTCDTGFTEYCICTPNQLFHIPKNSGCDEKYYALAEPMASAMDGMDLAEIKIGDTVLLSGCGAIGSIILNMLLLKGGTRVTVSDPVPEKRQLALEMGAQYVIDPVNEDLQERAMEITDGRGYDIIFDAAGVPKAAPPLLPLMAKKGTIVYFAVFPMDYELPVNLYEMYMKEGRLQTVYTTAYNYPRVIDLIPRMQMDKIVTAELPLTRAREAYDLFLEGKNNKILVKCSNYEDME